MHFRKWKEFMQKNCDKYDNCAQYDNTPKVRKFFGSTKIVSPKNLRLWERLKKKCCVHLRMEKISTRATHRSFQETELFPSIFSAIKSLRKRTGKLPTTLAAGTLTQQIAVCVRSVRIAELKTAWLFSAESLHSESTKIAFGMQMFYSKKLRLWKDFLLVHFMRFCCRLFLLSICHKLGGRGDIILKRIISSAFFLSAWIHGSITWRDVLICAHSKNYWRVKFSPIVRKTKTQNHERIFLFHPRLRFSRSSRLFFIQRRIYLRNYFHRLCGDSESFCAEKYLAKDFPCARSSLKTFGEIILSKSTINNPWNYDFESHSFWIITR